MVNVITAIGHCQRQEPILFFQRNDHISVSSRISAYGVELASLLTVDQDPKDSLIAEVFI
jgi:hypothetical protein